MLRIDLTMAEGVRLLAGQLQGPLGEQRRAAQRRPHHPSAPPAPTAGDPPGRRPDRLDAEGLLGVAADGAQADAQGTQQLGIAGPWHRHHPLVGKASQRCPGRGEVHPSRPQHPGGPALALDEHTEQDMLGAQGAVAAPLGLPGQVQDPMSRLAEPPNTLSPPDSEAFMRLLSPAPV
jgi:hypothetical protein